MMQKSQIKYWLLQEDWDSLKAALKNKPVLIRYLMGFLYHPEEETRWRAVKGFGTAAHVLNDEKIKDLLRRMLWSLNNESGTCCWFTPQAIGEIGYQRPDLIKDFLPSLQFYARDPDAMLRQGVQWALQRIAATGIEIPDFDEFFID